MMLRKQASRSSGSVGRDDGPTKSWVPRLAENFRLARMSHTARAPAVDDAADDDFAWVVARGSSTTGGCIGRRGLATSGKTLVDACAFSSSVPFNPNRRKPQTNT